MSERKLPAGIPENSGVLMPHQVIRSLGFAVCLEDCGCFGKTWLRETKDWDSGSSTTTYDNNATRFRTVEEAMAAYHAWMTHCHSNLAKYHRILNAHPEPTGIAPRPVREDED